ncbi:PEP-CTERM sorting domain-containing protein [Sphingomonas daechungensis]|uniref:PEP-CTERM sorting domain-containing protein n=2 Tax=Sphingomonas daechungensis TaxID=1176646 RepID=A0ABX6T169_9SPHN|nr:PEPxxWA-CTERM sorting domain-containing protein [Sphingomonas daechungensis]QNP43594.1 PEP-CTERM sorting domain-containing protein [Sphingomonas daechungensis]
MGAAALAFGSNANASVVTITPGTGTGAPTGISGFNDFLTQLNGLGLTSITTTGATITLDENSILTFEFLGSESGFSDNITAGSVNFTENSWFTAWTSVLLGSDLFTAGSLAGLINFSSVGGANATVGDDGFGIFLTDQQLAGYTGNVFYIGYDDQITNVDDNHDDMIIRVTVSPAVPEPATWAMMLLGFGAAGFVLRRRRRPVLAQAA